VDRNNGTLLLRLTGPMQSWGLQSRFTVRDTAREPTKSGVIGLVCAALGRQREAPVDDLGQLQMGVRVDREGTLARDYQTAGGARHGESYGVATVDNKKPGTVISNRYYLADADFLVGPGWPFREFRAAIACSTSHGATTLGAVPWAEGVRSGCTRDSPRGAASGYASGSCIKELAVARTP